ncbi:retrovirus-related pol polyprotein from transposon TNT 1-94 [Tanacetum coccineum]
MNLTKFEEGIDVINLLEEVGSSIEEVVKMGKANRNIGYNINKLTSPPSLRLEEIPPTSTIPPQLIYHPLTPKQKEKMKEVLDFKYKELEESKPILEMLENYVMYKKKLDEILIGKERLNMKEFSEEDKVGIYEHGLPKKMCDPRNYVFLVKFNGVVEMIALVDTRARVSVLPYSLYKDLGLDDLRPYETNLTMAANTQAKVMGEVKNKSRMDTLPNPLIVEYERRSKRNTITYLLQPVSNANLKWRDLSSVYIYEGDGDIFIDYSWERALSIDNEIYLEWVLEFFSTLYFDKNVDRNNLMKMWKYDEVNHHLFKVYFGKLEVDDKQFDHKDYWTRVGKPTLTNHKEVLVKEPLMRIMHKVIVGSLVHRVASRERCQKRDLWMMSALEESCGVNLAWIITDHLYKHASGTNENNVICAGCYVTKIACFLGYCMDDEIKKCLEPIDCEYWISKMLADELDVENTCLKKETEMPIQAEEGSSEPRQEHGGLNSRGSYGLGGDDYFTSAMPNFRGSSSGYAVGGLSRGAGFNDDDDRDE